MELMTEIEADFCGCNLERDEKTEERKEPDCM
jgi:hypothetical protein